MRNLIEIKVCKGVKREHIQRIIKKVLAITRHTFKINLYIFNDKKDCIGLSKKIKKNDRRQFSAACNSKIHFSYPSKNEYLVVLFSKDGGELARNEKAMMGLLLHEIEHLHQGNFGTHQKIKKELLLHLEKLTKFEGEQREIAKRVIENATLLLKDLYTNTQLIKEGLSEYLLEYYRTLFNAEKSCPEPSFYRNFKKEAEKNPAIVETVLKFEFALLAVSLPIFWLDKKKAIVLKKDISKCYEMNIKEIVRRCHLITDVYHHYFFTKNFNRIYFNKVFEILFRVFK